MTDEERLGAYIEAIRRSGLSIYDRVRIGDPKLWIPAPEMERILNNALTGRSLAGLPLRTRSKVAKQCVCEALGYPVPTSFRRTRPRFPRQVFDVYVQKSNNLQIWNEELEPTRRYVIIRVGEGDIITMVRVASGASLAEHDRTGALTQKYQASLALSELHVELSSSVDTAVLRAAIRPDANELSSASPTDHPQDGRLLPIAEIFDRLTPLIGHNFRDAGADQERNRGASLYQLVCQALGYDRYEDDGQFPDIRRQLLEVKLQTTPTIDLGLISPDSEDVLDTPMLSGQQIRHNDVRYAVFYAESDGETVTLTHLILTTGAAFFERFQRFGGRVINRKTQIRLPRGFFD